MIAGKVYQAVELFSWWRPAPIPSNSHRGRAPGANLRGRLAAEVLALCCLLLTACSGRMQGPVAQPTLAPVDVADAPRPASTRAAARILTPEDFASDPEAAHLGWLQEDPGDHAALEIPFDPEDPAHSDEEFALLDELMELTLPESPRILTHEEALLNTRSELPLVMNDAVQGFINYFTETSRGQATIRRSMGRGAAYRPMIQRILREEGVPAEIFYLAMAESGFQPKARSHAHATGMWQFISSRGKQYGLRQDRYVDLRYDPETATRAAARHLKDLHIEFGDWYLAMAAYNGGPNRVKNGIARTGSRDYWELSRRRVIYRETRNYVPIILAMTYVGQNLHLFDFGELDPAPEVRYDTIRTEGEISFALIADATGTSVETIKGLNHALMRSATPPYAYDLRLPKDSAEEFQREIALVPADKRLNWRRYEVRPGETVQALANRYKVSAKTLASLNSLPEGDALPGGMRLTIPTTTRLSIYRYYGAGAGGLLEPGTGRYKIASGDTLGGIARRFKTTVNTLLAWNGLTSTRIRAGRYLIVMPEGATGTASGAASSAGAPTGRYTVRRGDTLSGIGARVGASVAQLRAWNGIRGSTIHVGQSLKVPGSTSPAPQALAPGSNHYRIRSGDSLSTIAARFGVSISDLRAWNNLRSSRITAGKELLVRRPSSGSTGSGATTARSSRPAAPGSSTYVVRRGDTLGGIAERHGVTAAQLRAWNGIRGSRIYPGNELTVRQSLAGGQVRSYRIQRGDTLDRIAKRFNVTVSDLKRWNGLSSSRIYPGTTLTIRSAGS